MALFIYASSRHVRLYQLVSVGNGQWAEEDPPETYPSHAVTVLRFDHMDFFAEVPLLEDLLPSRKGVNQAVVICILRYIETLPSTTLKSIVRYSRELREDGNLLLLAGVRPRIFELLDRTGIIDAIGKENIFPAQRVIMAPLNEAMARAQEWLAQNKGVLEEMRSDATRPADGNKRKR